MDHLRATHFVQVHILIASLGRYLLTILALINLSDVFFSIITLLVAYLLHRWVMPYTGYNTQGFKQLDSIDDFVPLGNLFKAQLGQEIDAEAYQYVADNFTEQAQDKLAECKAKLGAITYYDFVNASLLDSQLFIKQRHAQEKYKAEQAFDNRNQP